MMLLLLSDTHTHTHARVYKISCQKNDLLLIRFSSLFCQQAAQKQAKNKKKVRVFFFTVLFIMLKKMLFYDLLWTYLYVSNSDGLIPVFMSDTDTCHLACLANCFLLCSTSNSADIDIKT